MQVRSVGVLRWDVSLSANLLPKVSMVSVRLMAWFAHSAAIVLAVLALILVWSSSGLAYLKESAYLDLLAILCLALAAVAFWHVEHLLRAQADKWRVLAEGGQGGLMQERGFVDGTGGSGDANSPALVLEDLALRTKRHWRNLSRDAESLAQPLLEARQQLQGHLDELAQGRPLRDARQRLQERLDELNVEARQRLSVHLDAIQASTARPGGHNNRPDWMQPLLDALAVPNGAAAITAGEAEASSASAASSSPVRAVAMQATETHHGAIGVTPDRRSPATEPLPPGELSPIAESASPFASPAARAGRATGLWCSC